jgi:hypothetical protein
MGLSPIPEQTHQRLLPVVKDVVQAIPQKKGADEATQETVSRIQGWRFRYRCLT